MFDTEKFISEIEMRPILYCIKDPNFHNKEQKKLMWEEVASAMYDDWNTFTPDAKEFKCKELSTKWKSVRDHFVKDVKRLSNPDLSTSLKRKRKYIYFNQLQFLLPNVGSRNFNSSIGTQRSDSENENENENSDFQSLSEIVREKIIDNDILNEIVSHESGGSNLSVDSDNDPDYTPKAKKKKKISNSISRSSNSKSNNSRSVKTNSRKKMEPADVLEVEPMNIEEHYIMEEDSNVDRMGNQAFLSSILPLMNKIPDDLIINLRVEIMQAIQNCLNN